MSSQDESCYNQEHHHHQSQEHYHQPPQQHYHQPPQQPKKTTHCQSPIGKRKFNPNSTMRASNYSENYKSTTRERDNRGTTSISAQPIFGLGYPNPIYWNGYVPVQNGLNVVPVGVNFYGNSRNSTYGKDMPGRYGVESTSSSYGPSILHRMGGKYTHRIIR